MSYALFKIPVLTTRLTFHLARQVYDPDLIKPLVSTIDLFLTHLPADAGSSSRSVLIAATVRNENTLHKFRHVCCKSGTPLHSALWN